MGKLPSLIKLLHKAWAWHTPISEPELFKSLSLFLLLNIFSAAAGASFPWQQSLLQVASTQAGRLTAPLHYKRERWCLGIQMGEHANGQHPHKKGSHVAHEGVCHNFSWILPKADWMAVGLVQNFRDSAFSLGVTSYSCWQVAEIKNGLQLPTQQLLLCLQLTGLSISNEGPMVRLKIISSPCYVSSLLS